MFITTIHIWLNRVALSSSLRRRVTYLCASSLAYVLLMWSVASLYLAELEIRFVAITVYSYGAAILARSIVEGIYIFYKRPRPSSADHIEPLIINTNPSFPSGHAAFFGALAFALVSVQAPFALEFSIATIIMCIARVAAGVHFLSDIAVGWLLGMGTTVLVFSMIGIY